MPGRLIDRGHPRVRLIDGIEQMADAIVGQIGREAVGPFFSFRLTIFLCSPVVQSICRIRPESPSEIQTDFAGVEGDSPADAFPVRIGKLRRRAVRRP